MKKKSAFLCLLVVLAGVLNLFHAAAQQTGIISSFDSLPEVLPGTEALRWQLSPQEVAVKMLDGAHLFIDEKIRESKDQRAGLWQRDFTSGEAYDRSVEPNRNRLKKYIGVVDNAREPTGYRAIPEKRPPTRMLKVSVDGDPEFVAETSKYRIYQVSWPVLNRVNGEGLLLQPKTEPVGNIIALPDADQTPEQLIGLAPGIPPQSQFARRLAESGYQVLVPVLISRASVYPGEQREQTYREWVYRQAFHMGRHLIGYEVQKVMAAVDWFEASSDKEAKIGVAGYAEGGLIAFYAAAVDQRIDAVMVSGYFSSREKVWDEPIYRNVWGLLSEFGDAEMATLVAPRPLVVEFSAINSELEASTEKPSPYDAFSYTGYKGRIKTPAYQEVESEFKRVDGLLKTGFQERILIAGDNNRPVDFGSAKAIEQFSRLLGNNSPLPVSDKIPDDLRRDFKPGERQIAQVNEIEAHVQNLMRDSDEARDDFFLYQAMPEFKNKPWSTKRYHPYFDPAGFIEKSKSYRKYFWEEVLGKFEEDYLPANARTRKIYDETLWTGYEVVLDVYTDLIAPGVLLLPKDIKPGEKRPVVVAQHGRNGVPQILIEGNTSYYDMAAKLADQGFVVYAPYGMFNGEDRYRWLDRKANTLKKTLFSFIVAQHDQTLQWLGSLPYVDPERIAFYGKSYGGETAMRVPAVLEGYSLSICSADFGDWTRKVIDTHYHNSFMHTIEWEMPYFNMGSTFSYAEMAYLIFPRPFMVERGRHDLVQPDAWVGYEYAKVSHLYEQFNKAGLTAIEFFNGGHASRNEGTFQFLHKHLNWP